MDAEIKEFIEKNIDLIENGEFEELYQVLNDRHKAPNLTETLLGADINPARYLKEIPPYYLEGTKIKSYTVPDNIASIGDYAFRGCDELTDITIGNNVKYIGRDVFYMCRNLAKVIIPEGVNYIGKEAFQYCTRLTDIILPNSLTSIGRGAFDGCSGLISVIIGNGVTSIDDYVFKHTKNLESINYLGTKDQWNKIKLKPLWNVDSRIERVECTDGVIELK